MSRRARTLEWIALASITLVAAALRLLHVGGVPPDPFYDAAVRSMTHSWHNFFFGAFEPGGSVSIDKPPIDLWLQVLSVKLLGFNSTTLKLPEALAGIAAVPLLYVLVRRIWSVPAAFAAACSMALLPIAVITARSDTMDAVMMLLALLAFAMAVHAVETGRWAWVFAAAAAMGIAFDVKLLESLIALPGLAMFALLGMPDPPARRALKLLAAGAVYVAIAVSWLTATLLFPASQRPYAIGSTNGSAWNAAFVFNGSDRLAGKTVEPGATVYEPGHRYAVATQEQRDHIPIVPPSPTRLLATIGPLSGERLGMVVLVALLLGAPALACAALARAGPPARRARLRAGSMPPGNEGAGPDVRALEGEAAVRLRLHRAAAAGLGVWLLTGLVLYSAMVRLHPRYVEAFTPAVAAIFGIGVAWAAAPAPARAGSGSTSAQGTHRAWRALWGAGRGRLALLAVTLALIVYYGERLLYGTATAWWVTLAGAIGAITSAVLARTRLGRARTGALLAPWGVIAFTLVASLAIPVGADSAAIRDRISDAGLVGQLPGAEQRPLSRFLLAHQDGAYYELASESATAVGSLIVQDGRPVLVLTTYDARVFTSVAQLKHLIALGKVRYAFLNTFCTRQAAAVNPACSASVRWVRAHGRDISRQAGLPRDGLLYLLPGAHP